ncbi:hypothetical protein [Hydrogenimonas sp. SS33]|uniref:hypothetical protein n=1 Tax=Hydrogenimonas leucolamina TaxID=2954236 RepID=UPI00336BD41C
MRIESLLAVTGGTLLNTPFVSRFDSVALSAKKVERGTLFIAGNREEITDAVLRGAYGIVAEPPLHVADEEIAWIEVADLQKALPKILRLWLVDNPRETLLVSRPVFEFLQMLHHGGELLFLEGSEEAMSERVLRSRPDQAIVTFDTLFLEHVGMPYTRPETGRPEARVLSRTLFETSLLLEGRFHPHLPLMPCMLPYFLGALALLKARSLPWHLSKLDYPGSCRPLFVDSRLRPLPFGASEKVLLFVNLPDPCPCIEAFTEAKWTGHTLFLPTHFKPPCDITFSQITYESVQELLPTLREAVKAPGYRIVAGVRPEIFLNAALPPSDTEKKEKGLF